jgi:hypothetical protein
MALVDEDHVEEVRWELRKPSIRRTGELLDVGNYEVALGAIMDIGVATVKDGEIGSILEVLKDARLRPEALSASDVKRRRDTFADRQVGGDDQDPTAGNPERERRHDPSLSAPDWDLQDGWTASSFKVLTDFAMCVSLWFAQQFVALDIGSYLLEKVAGICGFVRCPLILKAERLQIGTAVVAIAVARMAECRDPPLLIPTPERLRRDTNVLGSLSNTKILIA